MSQHLYYTGLLLEIELDGNYWLYTFHGGQQYYCTFAGLPLGHIVKVRHVDVCKPYRVISWAQDLGVPV